MSTYLEPMDEDEIERWLDHGLVEGFKKGDMNALRALVEIFMGAKIKSVEVRDKPGPGD